MSPNRKSLATTASEQIRAIIDAAEETAAQIRAEAEEEAGRVRREAEEEASGIRAEARGDVRELLDSIREGVTRLSADLEQLQKKLQPPAPTKPRAAPAPEPVSSAPTGGDDADLESARLVALNMALDGADRDEVDRYLSENFAVANRDALLDEVYASVGA